MISLNQTALKLFASLLITALLTACGGGGSASDSPSSFTNTANTNAKPQASSTALTSQASSAPNSLASSSTATSTSSSLISSSIKSSISVNSSSLKSTSSSVSISSISNAKIDTQAPSTPTNLTITAADYDLVSLSWTSSIDNIGVKYYKIYRNLVQIDQIDAANITYTDFNVASNSSYTYGISAGDDAGNWSDVISITVKTPAIPYTGATSSSSSSTSSSTSSSVQADTIPPSTPASVFQIGAYSTRVDIGWTAATDNVGVTGYKVYRDGNLLGSTSGSTLTFSDTTAQPAKQYLYGVTAGDAAGNWSSAQKTIFITTPASTAINGDVTLYWAAPTQRTNGDMLSISEIGGFTIRYKSSTDIGYTYADASSSLTSYTIRNLTGDFQFQIATYDINNLTSDFVSITPK